MMHQLLAPDVLSWSAATSACDKIKQWEASLGLLQEMTTQSVAPDVVSMARTASQFCVHAHGVGPRPAGVYSSEEGVVAPDEASSLGTGGPKRRRSPCCRAAVSLVWPGWRSHCTWGCFRPLWWLVCWGGYRPWLRLRFLPVPAFLGFKEWCVRACVGFW